MSDDKIQNTKESLYEWSKNIYVTEPDKIILRNGANAINQLQQESQQLKSQLQNISSEFLKYDWENSNSSQLKNQIKNLYYSIFDKGETNKWD